MAYLLDTNVCIALINGTSEAARKRFAKAAAATEPLWVPAVSLFELWYGVAKSVQTETNTRRLAMFLRGPVRVLEFGEEDARRAGEIRVALERAGKPIGGYDLLIAGQALSRGLTLVTANVREFGRVKGLHWEDWAKG
jgi:tRNA(fMet)-specific endonuclease VapC